MQSDLAVTVVSLHNSSQPSKSPSGLSADFFLRTANPVHALHGPAPDPILPVHPDAPAADAPTGPPAPAAVELFQPNYSPNTLLPSLLFAVACAEESKTMGASTEISTDLCRYQLC